MVVELSPPPDFQIFRKNFLNFMKRVKMNVLFELKQLCLPS